MIREDFHVHSTFSDGKSTAEEVVLSAIGKGMTRLGFSEHGYAACDVPCCIMPERIPEYLRTVSELREKYADKIAIYCGIEQDYMSEYPTDEFDYVIGSVHYLIADGEYCSVDYSAAKTREIIAKHFSGDAIAYAEAYFGLVSDIYDKTRCDIIGHFDLLTKFNEKELLIDTSSPRYIAAWKAAADRLLKTGAVFEINTGAISRGYRTAPYPAMDIMHYISDNGGSFVLSGDSHHADNLCYRFDQWESAARSEGIRLVNFSLK